MASAPAPRSPTLAASLARLQNRVRWLETNMQPSQTVAEVAGVNVGTAQYEVSSYSESYASTQTPSFAGATATVTDELGCTPTTSGIEVNPGANGLVVVNFRFQIELSGGPSGVLSYDAYDDPGAVDDHAHPIWINYQNFSMQLTGVCSSGSAYIAYFSSITSSGSSFKVLSMTATVQALFS